MLARLAVVVLIVVGPVPYRLCFCAHHHDDATAPASEQVELGNHEAPASEHHEHDEATCPCCQKHTAPPATPTTSVDRVPDSAGELLALPVALLNEPTHLPATRSTSPRAPARPLFITLLTLRN